MTAVQRTVSLRNAHPLPATPHTQEEAISRNEQKDSLRSSTNKLGSILLYTQLLLEKIIHNTRGYVDVRANHRAPTAAAEYKGFVYSDTAGIIAMTSYICDIQAIRLLLPAIEYDADTMTIRTPQEEEEHHLCATYAHFEFT